MAVLCEQAGYWRRNNKSTALFECQNKFACPASTDGSMQCSNDTDTSFPLCAVCKENSGKNSVGVCEPCEDTLTIILIFLASVLAVALVLYLFAFAYVRFIIINKGENTLSRFPSPSQLFKRYKEHAQKNDDGKHWGQRLRTYFKLFISFYQIISSLPNTLAASYPKIYTDFTSKIGPVVNWKVMSLGETMPVFSAFCLIVI